MSSSPPLQARRSAGEVKKTSPSSIVTRNGARKAKIQTRAMSAAKPSASVIAAKRKAQQKKKQPMDTLLRDPYQIAMESKSKVKGPTGFVTDPRMAEHCCLWDDNYPECPERLIGVLERCRELNLIDQCKVYPPRAATKDEIVALHAPSVYNLMEETHGSNDLKYLEEVSSGFDAVYIHPSTHEMALSAAGSTLDMVDRLVSDELQNAAVLVRPPGHHAMRAEPCGYCVYNNVALGAQRALQLGLKRILIVDWDVHHGQATQQMFYDDPRVVYFSVHRYEHGSFWPNLRQSDFPYTGCGQGEGYTFNVPLNDTGMTDADYIAIWHQVLLPMAFEFSPELIIVSAGYDAAIGDEKGEMEVSPACYASLVHMLQGVCPRLLLALEGGYCLRSLADAAALTLRTMLGHAPPALPPAEPCDQIRDSILNCIYSHKKHWRCFNYQPTYSIDTTVLNVCDGEKEKHVVTFKWEGDETRSDKFATRNCYPLQDDAFKKRINEKLDHLQMVTDLSLPKHPVLYIYDQTMLKHHNVCEPGHVECPERIMRIHERHRDFGLLDRLHQLPARSATDEEILSVHTKEYLDSLKELSSTKLRDLNSQKNSFDSVYFHPDSLQSASAAVGGVLQMVDAVLSAGGAGACVVRPPGHHAAAAAPRGFCLLNSVVVAARRAAAGGARVLLLDWDVHHGDGTQAATYHDDKILYMSIHRYDNGSFFPHSTAANYTAVGEGKGEGYNINIPWNKRGMGDAEYLSALAAVVLPVAYEYSPDLVLVSAGFDACVGDPLGGCKVTPECFGRMTHMLRGLAGGRIILCLEGGYNVTSISYAMTMCTKALLGDPIQYHYDPKQTVHWSAVESINNVIKTHKKYWKSLKFQLALPIEDVIGPLPKSRGLPDSEEANIDYTKVVSDKLQKDSIYDSNLAEDISALSIQNRCPDGIHCGTDDESEAADKADVPNSSQAGSNESAGSSKMNESGSAVPGGKPTTLVDYLSENMPAIVNEEMFAVIPLTWCPHLESLYAIPGSVRLEQGVKCVSCDHTEENWVCLHCYITACGRHVNGHMQEHFQSTQHSLALSLTDLSVWCSVCDAYVDNALLYDAKNNAHRCKFGEDMPWCYSNAIHMH